MDILGERYGLVSERLEQIYQETAVFSDESKRYWHLCAGLALGKGKEDMHFLDYSFCSRVFGEKGRYLCLLYAQMMQILGFRKKGQAELVCICCELLAELYRMTLDDEGTKAIRNTLYWFYSDYSACYIGYLIDGLAEDPKAAVAGGPMLLMDAEVSKEDVWKQHKEDFGLYMGSRFEERCYQAVMLKADEQKSTAIRQFAELLLAHAKALEPVLGQGFQAAERQRGGLAELCERILEHV